MSRLWDISPVLGPAGEVVAAVGVVVPSTHEARMYVPAVLAAARGISRAVAGGS